MEFLVNMFTTDGRANRLKYLNMRVILALPTGLCLLAANAGWGPHWYCFAFGLLLSCIFPVRRQLGIPLSDNYFFRSR
ncbi:MAG TPA: hypothetical protein PKO23_17960, partial [Candidatus Hydrogenedentes bacterium]|nr:hypothetical protein [Candidatus Hydrogenedentota bacterium]